MDIEVNDLTRIFCLVIIDTDNNNTVYDYKDDNVQLGLDKLMKADKICGHNIIGFDIPMVKKFGGVDLSHKPDVDTLVMSRLFNPVREGGHSLAEWGRKVGHKKPEHEDWSKYSRLQASEQIMKTVFKT